MYTNFRDALELVTTELKATPEVKGILFFGSVQLGDPTHTSDLDLFAIVEGCETWNFRRLVEGIEVEVYFLPADLCHQNLENGNITFVKAFATGAALLDLNGKLAELAAFAKQIYDMGPSPLNLLEQGNWRIRLSDLIRDLEGISPEAPESHLLAPMLVTLSLEAYCAFHRLWTEKHSRLIKYVFNHNPQFGQSVIQFFKSPVFQPDQAISIADNVLEPFGGRLLEYEGPHISI
ncbi:nucleotidyltransferase domain-containing protein [Paenibacillus eucommiae]|uniref:Nucleotidyltransferase n=1 Tax=Paenibacillus eucommiae TaxID=1355755 RepID=A0ABS4J3M0_9BACL|nr:hypothetical protein [Paenibacillus eucommiae]MBP1994446.1 putative nucleotidyltransferase [Paenibacillus eucommiae]